MQPCGLCGIETNDQPRISAEGECDQCGMELAVVDEDLESESE